MPGRLPPPNDIMDAINSHWAAHSLEQIDLALVGKPGSRSTRLELVWHDGSEWQEAWFRCNRCHPGFDHYLVEVERPEPSHRILPLIQAHLATHQVELDGAEELGTTQRPNPTQKAFYYPPHARGGASLTCPTCKQRGFNPVVITDPPYGDARRLNHVRRKHPALALKLSNWPSSEQAAYLDALDQGLLDRPDPVAAKQALRNSHRPAPRTRRSLKNEALVAWMDEREATGESPARFIEDIADQSDTNPIGFAGELGLQLIRLGVIQRTPNETPKDLAERVRRVLSLPIGKLPTVSGRSLYRLREKRGRSS
jgi:hypothetical protein